MIYYRVLSFVGEDNCIQWRVAGGEERKKVGKKKGQIKEKREKGKGREKEKGKRNEGGGG